MEMCTGRENRGMSDDMEAPSLYCLEAPSVLQLHVLYPEETCYTKYDCHIIIVQVHVAVLALLASATASRLCPYPPPPRCIRVSAVDDSSHFSGVLSSHPSLSLHESGIALYCGSCTDSLVWKGLWQRPSARWVPH